MTYIKLFQKLIFPFNALCFLLKLTIPKNFLKNIFHLDNEEQSLNYLTDDFYYERSLSLFNPLKTDDISQDLLTLQYPFTIYIKHQLMHFVLTICM